MQNRHTLEPTLTVARSQELCARSVLLCTRAEASILKHLAQTDAFGRADGDLVRWSAQLARWAALHARVQTMKEHCRALHVDEQDT